MGPRVACVLSLLPVGPIPALCPDPVVGPGHQGQCHWPLALAFQRQLHLTIGYVYDLLALHILWSWSILTQLHDLFLSTRKHWGCSQWDLFPPRTARDGVDVVEGMACICI